MNDPSQTGSYNINHLPERRGALAVRSSASARSIFTPSCRCFSPHRSRRLFLPSSNHTTYIQITIKSKMEPVLQLVAANRRRDGFVAVRRHSRVEASRWKKTNLVKTINQQEVNVATRKRWNEIVAVCEGS